MTTLYRNQLRLVLQGYERTFSDLGELYSAKMRVSWQMVNKYSDITIEEITNRIKELESLAT